VLVAIAGADGAGKTTLSRQVHQALVRRGIDAVRLDRFDILDAKLSPASSFIDTDVLTLRQSVLQMPTASARLLFMLWSMAITVSHQLNNGDAGKVVVYDSYWMKHTAAEIVFGAQEKAALAAACLLPQPDLTLYLKLEPATLLQRKRGDLVPYECGLDPACEGESFLRHQRRILSHLDSWSHRFGWQEIDGDQASDVLMAELVRRIEKARPSPNKPGRHNAAVPLGSEDMIRKSQ
jgi:thymidylate kinase